MNTRFIIMSLLALLAGVFLGWVAPSIQAHQPQVSALRDAEFSTKSNVSSQRTAKNLEAAGNVTSETLKQAWQNLMMLSAAEFETEETRGKLRAVLAEWIQIDPRSCLRAWADYTRKMNGIYLFDAFSEICQTNPALMRSHICQYLDGLDRGFAMDQWIGLMGNENCNALLAEFDASSFSEKRLILQGMSNSFQMSSKQRKILLEKVANLPESASSRLLVEEHIKGEALVQFDYTLKDMSEAESDAMIRYYAFKLARCIRADDQSYDVLTKKLAELPIHVRETAEQELLKNTEFPSVPLLQLKIDTLRETNEWASHANQLAVQLHNATMYNKHPKETAEWSLGLPQTSEFEDLYRVGMRAYANRKPLEYAEWIQQFPPGWQRDNAMVEQVNSLMNDKSKASAAIQILPNIQDETLRSTAQQMIQNRMAK